MFFIGAKKIDQDSFNETLKNRVFRPNLSSEVFFETYQSTLDFFAPYKQTKNQV